MWNVLNPAFSSVKLPSAFELNEFNQPALRAFGKYLYELESNEIPFASLNINSFGGSSDYLNGFLGLIEEYRKRGMKFCGVVTGHAYSAGALTFLYMDAEYRFCLPSANLMLHQLFLFTGEDRLSSIKNNTDTSHKQQLELFSKVSKHLKKKSDWLTKELKSRGEDWYFSAKEAKEMGLAQIGLPSYNLRLAAEFSITS